MALETSKRDLSPVYWALKLCFGFVPVIAGLDKVTNLLVAWPKYLAPAFASLIPLAPQSFMHLVGVIEIIAGIGVLLTPWTRVFAWIVAIWLWCISLNLIVAGFYDIAVRDIVLGVSSLCLARVSLLLPHAPGARRELTPAQV
ncbi:MAG TPA: DoxX family membrane protein [Myxococcales bacterium]|nr:DoxX family membrane protein [Myxococcales bacterium]